MKFDGLIIISDIDGTYTGSDEGIRRNKAAIAYFKENGGLFTFASGRVEYTIHTVVPEFFELVNAPAVLCNGSYLYDPVGRRRLNELCVDASFALPFLVELSKKFPGGKVRINRGEQFYTPSVADIPISSVTTDECEVISCPYDAMPTDGWNKVVFSADAKTVLAAQNYAAENAPGRFALSRSWASMLELLDPRATKGNQVRYLKSMLGGNFTAYCAGDYENDEDMLRKADVSVVPASGLPRLVQAADLVACPCSEGSIAWLVDKLKVES